MGNSSRATVAFGVDLGNPEYGEWNFEEGPYHREDDEEFDFDDLIAEFAGWDEVQLKWANRSDDQIAHNMWSRQLDRRRSLLESVGIEVGAWGYEYSGQYLYITDTQQSDSWAPVPLEPIQYVGIDAIRKLVEFIELSLIHI